jgi:broad specificity phosphatase PhoE
MKLLLIRHGQTRWNREQIFRGGADVPLDRTGMAQAHALAARLRSVRIAAVYSGPLSRARRTAELVAAPHRLPVSVIPGLDDMRFGLWEGKSLREVERSHPAQYARWKTAPWKLAIPGGTTLRQVESRSWRAVRAISGTHEKDEVVVIVTHRVVLKLLILKMLGIGITGFWRLALDPCSLTVVECDGSRFTLEQFNDTGHLRPRKRATADF